MNSRLPSTPFGPGAPVRRGETAWMARTGKGVRFANISRYLRAFPAVALRQASTSSGLHCGHLTRFGRRKHIDQRLLLLRTEPAPFTFPNDSPYPWKRKMKRMNRQPIVHLIKEITLSSPPFPSSSPLPSRNPTPFFHGMA